MTTNRTITELYQALRPLLLRDVASAVGGSGGTGGGGMETHALDGAWHTGSLAESQAPWAATKNEWATALATHAALPDVHHAAVTAGTLIGLSGQQVSVATGAAYQFIGTGGDTVPEWRNVSELAGNGLTATNGVLAVGVSGLGLSVAADAVALASSSNPGAAASILATNASGGLTLASLGVTGAATVGGDFTVGANVLFVNQAGTRVGINRAPDQQFDLDVAGAIRGQYLVGKHAIQLASAVGVWHFDGSAPYNLDFTGSNASHMGGGGTEAGGVIFRPGRYGKAVQVAPATTNLVTNPSMETGTSDGAKANCTIYLSESNALFGVYGQILNFANGSGPGVSTTYWRAPYDTVTRGTTYTYSIHYKIISAGGGTWTAVATGDENVGSATLIADGEWRRAIITGTASGSGNASIGIRIYLAAGTLSSDATIAIDGYQLEQLNYATPYCDGSLGTGHSWSGTAHASTSSRTAASLSYAANMLRLQAGTIQMWINARLVPASYIGLFLSGATAEWDAYVDSSGTVYWRTDGNTLSGGTVTADTWTHLAFSWDATANSKIIYVNGVQVATATYGATATLGTLFYLGMATGASLRLNGMIDEFVLTDYAMDAKLVRAIYESDAPVFVESSVFHWRAPSRVPIWVDEFGLWARGVSGNEILGLYGGDPRNPTGGVTKSWGGVTLSENDVLIGRAAGGYVFWDDSAQVLNLKGTMVVDGNSYLNGVVTIAAGGELRQGTGTIGSNYTGLRIWRDGDVGRIGGYNANTLQWYAGTDGKLYSGGGNVVIGASGIALSPNYEDTTIAFTSVGDIYALYDAGSGGNFYIRVGYDLPKTSIFHLECYSGTTIESSISLYDTGNILIVGAPYFDSPLTLGEVASTPSNPTSGNQGRIYIRNDNLIVQWNDGGTIRYKYLPLSGTGTTWTHTTTAP